MKAVLLIAGLGTRLKPLTDQIPKCLVEIRGKPLLEYWLDNLAVSGCTELFLNGFYLPEKVEEFLDRKRMDYPFPIHFILEKELSGTGGFLRVVAPELMNEDFFFFGHGDNYCNIDLTEFMAAHRGHGGPLTVALFHAENPSQCGIVDELAPDGRILKFVEKPSRPATDLASAALFMMSPGLLADIPAAGTVDFSREVLPRYQGRMYGFLIDGFNLDIGTPEQYAKAQTIEWSTT